MPADGDLWAWTDLLPPCAPLRAGGESDTSLIDAGDGVLLKDDGELPTGTFKARGAALGVGMARALGAGGVALPSAGNAGAAWAAYCAAAGLPSAVWMASDAPAQAIEQARAHGAEVTVVPGGIGDAAKAAEAEANARGWHYAATFREPWRVEGKKTAFLEIVRALGGRMPDAAVLPVGGGVGAVAWHKAAAELRGFGWASGATRIYAVQAEGCAPIVRAFERGEETVAPWEDPRTAAPGIRIPAPLAGALVLRALRESGGGAVAVSEQEMSAARDRLQAEHGIPVLEEAGAALAGAERLAARGAIGPGETVVVYLTGRRVAAGEGGPV